MVNRTQRKLLYGAVYVLLFSIIGIGIFGVVKPEPSCFDEKQNQGEEEIDCGGPCSDCALRTLQSIGVSDVKFANVDGFIIVAAEFSNPNNLYGAESFEYVLTISNSDGRSVYTGRGTTFLYARERKPIVRTITGVSPASVNRITFTMENVRWKPASEFRRPQFSLSVRETKKDTQKEEIRISGVLRNEEARQYSAAEITALLYDTSGAFVGAAKTQLNIEGFEEKEFTILHPFVENIDPDLIVLSVEAK